MPCRTPLGSSSIQNLLALKLKCKVTWNGLSIFHQLEILGCNGHRSSSSSVKCSYSYNHALRTAQTILFIFTKCYHALDTSFFYFFKFLYCSAHNPTNEIETGQCHSFKLKRKFTIQMRQMSFKELTSVCVLTNQLQRVSQSCCDLYRGKRPRSANPQVHNIVQLIA